MESEQTVFVMLSDTAACCEAPSRLWDRKMYDTFGVGCNFAECCLCTPQRTDKRGREEMEGVRWIRCPISSFSVYVQRIISAIVAYSKLSKWSMSAGQLMPLTHNCRRAVGAAWVQQPPYCGMYSILLSDSIWYKRGSLCVRVCGAFAGLDDSGADESGGATTTETIVFCTIFISLSGKHNATCACRL